MAWRWITSLSVLPTSSIPARSIRKMFQLMPWNSFGLVHRFTVVLPWWMWIPLRWLWHSSITANKRSTNRQWSHAFEKIIHFLDEVDETKDKKKRLISSRSSSLEQNLLPPAAGSDIKAIREVKTRRRRRRKRNRINLLLSINHERRYVTIIIMRL